MGIYKGDPLSAEEGAHQNLLTQRLTLSTKAFCAFVGGINQKRKGYMWQSPT
jgi:hypothetical protein